MSDHTAKLRQEPIFTVLCNGLELKGYRLLSEWEGFKKLEQIRTSDQIILATKKAGGPTVKAINELFGRFLSEDNDTGEDFHLLMASPDVIAQLQPAKATEVPA